MDRMFSGNMVVSIDTDSHVADEHTIHGESDL